MEGENKQNIEDILDLGPPERGPYHQPLAQIDWNAYKKFIEK